MKILGSVVSLLEARTLIDLGIDIVDVKNPAEGSLGAQTPAVIGEISEFANSRGVAVSVALGDLVFQPGTAALAAFGAAQFLVHLIKVGLHGVRCADEAEVMLSAAQSAVRSVNPTISVVAAGYADYRRFGGLAPGDLTRAASRTKCDVVMLDTSIKDGADLFAALSFEELEQFVRSARELGLQVAVAGSLSLEHLPLLSELCPDIIGVRGALCGDNARLRQIDPIGARRFLDAFRDLSNSSALSAGSESWPARSEGIHSRSSSLGGR